MILYDGYALDLANRSAVQFVYESDSAGSPDKDTKYIIINIPSIRPSILKKQLKYRNKI